MADPTTSPDTNDAAGPVTGPQAPVGNGVEPAATDSSANGADLGRRRFFRQFAGDIASTAATVMGAAQAIQRTSAELAGAILDPTRAALDEAAAEGAAATDAPLDPAAAGFRTSFRVEDGAIVFVDQRALPRTIVEHSAVSAAEVTYAVRSGVVHGGPAIGQAAAVGLALTAERNAATRPYARRATLRGASNALRNVAQTHASVGWAVDRVMAAYRAVGELEEDGSLIATAMRAEADRIVAEATDDHGRLVAAGVAAIDALPRTGDEPLRVLVHGVSGTLAGGQCGTALSIAIAAHHADRPVRVIVPEGRHGFTGSRISCWELAAAGVPYLLVADAAAPALIAGGEVDLVLVPADRVAANGDVAATIGTYPIAAAAARRNVPVLVCAPLSTIDGATSDGAAITIASRPEAELDRFGDVVLAPRGTEVLSPGHDVTPADLVTYYVTGEGLRRPPFDAPPVLDAGLDAPPADAAPGPETASAPEPADTRQDEAG